jgi:hypothetical protein
VTSAGSPSPRPASRNGGPPGATTVPGRDGEVRSYHGQPILKEPVWTWEIPCYFFTGGLGGSAAGLAWLAGLRGNETLSRRSWAVALAGIGVSPVFLISDLGRPGRFLNMLRLVKITSPMSIGSWILSATGTATGVAAANAWLGILPRSARVARPLAALLGLPLSTYTAALIADTAIPVWHEARRELPFVFAAGAALSAGAAVVAVTPVQDAGAARRLALAGAVLEVATERVMEKRLGEQGEPYEQGLPHRLSRATQACLAVGGGLLAWRGGRSRAAAVAGGTLLAAGALSTRWSVFRAGFASVADPKYVVRSQRERIARAGRSRASRSTGR